MSEEIKKEIIEEETITLKEVCEVCEKYNNQELSQSELQEWIKKIKVSNYMSIYDKVYHILSLLFAKEMDEDEDLIWQIADLEQYKFWDILLAYTNINTEDFKDYMTFVCYDEVYSVIGDYILVQCYADYDRTIKMFESMVNMYNVKDLLKAFENFDASYLENSDKEIKKQLDILDKSKKNLQDITKILSGNISI